MKRIEEDDTMCALSASIEEDRQEVRVDDDVDEILGKNIMLGEAEVEQPDGM